MTFTQKIQKAINTSARLHKAHVRIGLDLPYIVHPYSVACLLSQYTDNEDIICAGFLHDILEDSNDYTYEDLENDFGETVARIVQGVTETRIIDRSMADTWYERKNGYIEGLHEAPVESLMVCAADTTHNLESLLEMYRLFGASAWSNFHASIEEKMDFYRRVIDIVRSRLENGIVNDLDNAYNLLSEELGNNPVSETEAVSVV